MSARQRLIASFKNYLTLVGIALIITVGFPYTADFMEIPKQDLPGLTTLDAMGYYVLRAAPIILILLFFYNIFSVKYRQKKINQKIEESGITYLMLPRADGEPVRADQVTLWHRLAMAMPYYEHFSFEMTGGEDGVVFSLRTTDDNTAKNVLSKVIAEWPGTQMRTTKEDPLPTEAYFIEVKPMKNDQPIVPSTPDPMKALLSEIAILPKGMKAGLQVLIREDPFTRLSHTRKASNKTRKKQNSKMSFLIADDGKKKNPYSDNRSAEDQRKIRWLDERAQEAFVETRLIIWATCESDELARRTATNLAKTVTAQYHPNNKLIKGWGVKKGNVRARQFPTFSGRPWVCSELGTIAHLVGKDAVLAAPQLITAPARPLPASTECRIIIEQVKAVAYLLEDSESDDLPALIIEDESDLPALIIEDESDLVALIIEDESDLPALMIEDESDPPALMIENELLGA